MSRLQGNQLPNLLGEKTQEKRKIKGQIPVRKLRPWQKRSQKEARMKLSRGRKTPGGFILQTVNPACFRKKNYTPHLWGWGGDRRKRIFGFSDALDGKTRGKRDVSSKTCTTLNTGRGKCARTYRLGRQPLDSLGEYARPALLGARGGVIFGKFSAARGAVELGSKKKVRQFGSERSNQYAQRIRSHSVKRDWARNLGGKLANHKPGKTGSSLGIGANHRGRKRRLKPMLMARQGGGPGKNQGTWK